MDIVGAFASGLKGGKRIWLIIIGILSIAVGIVVLRLPGERRPGHPVARGLYLIAYGVLRIVDGFTRPPEVVDDGLTRRLDSPTAVE